MPFFFPLLCLLIPCLLLALPIPPHNPPSPPQNSPPTRVPIGLLHMYDSVSFFRRLGTLSSENKIRYAKRHSYDMIISTPGKTSGILKQVECHKGHVPDGKGKCWEEDKDFDIDHTRAPTFGKIRLALASCRGRDEGWLLWSDADALVMNQSLPLEALIDDGYDLMFAYDWLMMNAGMLLIKCSDWSKTFLQTVYDARRFDKARALDQSAIQEHVDNMTQAERSLHVKVVPKHAMNVYTEEYRPGDFLMHFAGKLYEATEPGIVAIATQFDILSMVDDIEDIRAFFRGRRFLNYYSGTCPVGRGHKQSECKTDDPRRLLLNESLGSMANPNRYRHVGLRYYWLGDWKDKYDVPGWNEKRKALPMPELAPPGKEMPPVPVLSKHDQVGNPLGDGINGNGGMVKDSKMGIDSIDKDEEKKMDMPEVDHEVEGLRKDDDGDDDDDDGEDATWSSWLTVMVGGAGIGLVGAGIFVLRRRRKKSSKMQ